MQLRRLADRREGRALVLIVLLLIVGAIKAPRLLEAASVSSIILGLPILIVVAVGQMPVIVSRGVDLSVGSTLGLAGISAGMMMRANPHAPLILAVGVAAGVGFALGALNGGLIAYAKIPPILATLGGLSAYRGLAFYVSESKQIDANDIPSSLNAWAQTGPLRIGTVTIPWMFLGAVALAALVGLWTRRTGIGRDVFALGSNPEAATLRGVRTRRALLAAYALCGTLAGIGGLLYAARYGFVNPGSAGRGFELTVIAAVVIGGCDVRGGTGSITGVLLGCVLLASLDVALAVLGIAADWQVFTYGAVILLALVFEALSTRRLGGAAT
ncbi:MAG: ABC transporter permease [Fimbriimonadaceae bacterium]